MTTMMLRGGTLITQTNRGKVIGDVLIEDGVIAAVGEHLPPLPLPMEEMDVSGLTVLPGLIDLHVHQADEEEEDLARQALKEGVATLALFRGRGGCTLFRSGEAEEDRLLRMDLDALTDETLRQRLEYAEESRLRPICEVTRLAQGERILSAVRDTGVPAILIHLTRCGSLAEEIAALNCPAVLGSACIPGEESPFSLAVRLDELGALVALTCDYPLARMAHLPLCASLCERAGMLDPLRTITRNAADILGLTDAGRIQPGMRGDLALYDGDPLRLATDLVGTVSGGVYRGKQRQRRMGGQNMELAKKSCAFWAVTE